MKSLKYSQIIESLPVLFDFLTFALYVCHKFLHFLLQILSVRFILFSNAEFSFIAIDLQSLIFLHDGRWNNESRSISSDIKAFVSDEVHIISLFSSVIFEIIFGK